MFFPLFKANLKRLTKYLPSVIISVFILLAICMTAGLIISKNLYKDTERQPVSVAYYLPESEDLEYMQLAIGMLEGTNSMQETISLVRVFSSEDGYKMLENGDALYFLIVPERFVYGILDSTNTPLTIVTKDTESANSYITNELFLSYGTYLGIAQAAVYSVLDFTRAAGYSDEEVSAFQDSVNMTFIDRSLNKSAFINNETATLEGKYTVTQHYLASAVMLVLFFTGLVMMPFMINYSKGILASLETYGINKFYLYIQNSICLFIAAIAAYIPCHIVICIYEKSFSISGLNSVFIALLFISLINGFIGTMSASELAGNMALFTVTLLLAYIGGGIIPDALLPKAVSDISGFLPGKYIIDALSHGLFGGGYGI